MHILYSYGLLCYCLGYFRTSIEPTSEASLDYSAEFLQDLKKIFARGEDHKTIQFTHNKFYCYPPIQVEHFAQKDCSVEVWFRNRNARICFFDQGMV